MFQYLSAVTVIVLCDVPAASAPKFVVAFTPVAIPNAPEFRLIAPEVESTFTAPNQIPQSVPTPVSEIAPLVVEIVVGVAPEP